MLLVIFVVLMLPFLALMAWGLGRIMRSAGSLMERGRREEARRREGDAWWR